MFHSAKNQLYNKFSKKYTLTTKFKYKVLNHHQTKNSNVRVACVTAKSVCYKAN